MLGAGTGTRTGAETGAGTTVGAGMRVDARSGVGIGREVCRILLPRFGAGDTKLSLSLTVAWTGDVGGTGF